MGVYDGPRGKVLKCVDDGIRALKRIDLSDAEKIGIVHECVSRLQQEERLLRNRLPVKSSFTSSLREEVEKDQK